MTYIFRSIISTLLVVSPICALSLQDAVKAAVAENPTAHIIADDKKYLKLMSMKRTRDTIQKLILKHL